MTKKYKITDKKHPHVGCTGVPVVNDPEFPMRTYTHFPPTFAFRLDETHQGTSVCYVDRTEVKIIDGLDT